MPISTDAIAIVALPGAWGMWFEIHPWHDSDAYVCTMGGVLNAGTRRWPQFDECFLVTGQSSPFGCEHLGALVQPGQTVVLRVFNVRDVSPIYGRYFFFLE